MNGECIDHSDEKTSDNHNDDENLTSNSTFTPSGNYTLLFSCSDPRPSICGTKYTLDNYMKSETYMWIFRLVD